MFQDLLKRIEINELNQMNRPLKALDGSVGFFLSTSRIVKRTCEFKSCGQK